LPNQLRLVEQIENLWPFGTWRAFRVLVAVSGGRDSVALLRALVHTRDSGGVEAELFVGHFNHKLRGEESDADETFVREFCRQVDVEFVAGQPEEASGTDEASLRELRYRFLEESARKLNCRYIATAHHAADQVETVLFRIFRGTGIGGIAGIPSHRVIDDSITIVRPMLECLPEDIDVALKHWGQKWREDASNEQSMYARNFLRNDVLPLLRDRFGEQLLPGVLAMTDAASFEVDGRVVVRCDLASGQDKVVLRQMFVEIFRRQRWPLEAIGFEELQRLADLVAESEDVAAFDLPGAVSCQKTGGGVFLRR